MGVFARRQSLSRMEANSVVCPLPTMVSSPKPYQPWGQGLHNAYLSGDDKYPKTLIIAYGQAANREYDPIIP